MKKTFVLFAAIIIGSYNCIAQTLTANAGNNTTICQTNSITIGGSPTASGGTAPYIYSWAPSTNLSSTSVANPTATPMNTTTYTVTVQDVQGNTATNSVTITVSPINSTILITSSAPTVCAGYNITFTASPYNGGNSPTFQWFEDSSNLGSSSSSTFSYILSHSGSVYCEMTSSNPCVQSNPAVSPSLFITVDTCTGINEVASNENISLFPNPATTNLSVIANAAKQSIISIFNTQGQLIKTLTVNGTKTNIDVSDLSYGVYMVRVKTDKGIAVKKFIKE